MMMKNVERTMRDAAKEAGRAAEDLKDAVKDRAEDVGKAVERGMDSLQDKAGHVLEQMKRTMTAEEVRPAYAENSSHGSSPAGHFNDDHSYSGRRRAFPLNGHR